MFTETFSVWDPEGRRVEHVTRKVSMRESQAEAQRRLPFKMYRGNVAMGREVLSSPVFRVGIGPRQEMRFAAISPRGVRMMYEGPELRQDDARVIEFLIHEVRNRPVTSAIEFVPMEFVARVGWDRHHRSVEKLRACIKRMQRAVLQIESKGRDVSVQLVGKLEERQASGRWTVHLDDDIKGLFAGGPTWIPLERRRQLSDGLQSWLASFLYANDGEHAFALEDLLRYSGSASSLENFGAAVRGAIPRILSADRFSFKRGVLILHH